MDPKSWDYNLEPPEYLEPPEPEYVAVCPFCQKEAEHIWDENQWKVGCDNPKCWMSSVAFTTLENWNERNDRKS